MVANVDARPVREAAPIKDLLVRQVTTSGYWEQCVRRLVDLGGGDVVEVGCGKMLAGLIRRIENRKLAMHTTASAEEVQAAIDPSSSEVPRG